MYTKEEFAIIVDALELFQRVHEIAGNEEKAKKIQALTEEITLYYTR